MRKSIKEGKLLYHLTSLANIESILTDGLRPRSKLTEDFKDVADKDIVEFRNQNKISHTTPFHFFAGTPFSGRVQLDHPEEKFVYITLHRDIAKKNDFKIFPTHPGHMNPLKVYNYKKGLKLIDWDLMDKRDYKNNECKEACMAECVAPFKSIKAKNFHSIIVRDEETKDMLEQVCIKVMKGGCRQKFYVDVQEWSFV